MQNNRVKLKCTENQVKAAISDYLSARKIPHWRQNSGGYTGEYEKKDGAKKKRFFRFMQWLWPQEELVFLDLGGIWPDGRHLEIEVKATDKKPTKAQTRTIEFLEAHNCVVIWANSIDMFIDKFERIIPL